MTREGQRKLAQVKFNYLSLGDDQDDDEEDEEGGAGGGQRKQLPINYLFHELLETDPVLVTSLHEFVQQKLQELTTQVMSPEELSQGILREMDQTVMARILSNDYRMIEDEGYDDANCDP
jgi:regulator of PEP synthase PpsR (kinase-PPPase family)